MLLLNEYTVSFGPRCGLSRNRWPMNEIPTETHAPPAAAPVSDTERLKLIDALRGVALLGILLMNMAIP
jgi:hypothetical protein